LVAVGVKVTNRNPQKMYELELVGDIEGISPGHNL
jgi:hypothetical protein